jgi:hypothetical protein
MSHFALSILTFAEPTGSVACTSFKVHRQFIKHETFFKTLRTLHHAFNAIVFIVRLHLGLGNDRPTFTLDDCVRTLLQMHLYLGVFKDYLAALVRTFKLRCVKDLHR